MTPQIKAALTIAGAIIIATAAWIFFSPFQSCMRALPDEVTSVMERLQVLNCVRAAGGGYPPN